MMTATLITRMEVRDLFGLYDYVLPQEEDLNNAAILYGDNGAGKSTVLRLAFHLLSAANNRGHRTALYAADFSCLRVDLANGSALIAERLTKRGVTYLRLAIQTNGSDTAVWEYAPDNERLFDDEYREVYVYQDANGTTRRRLRASRRPDGVAHGQQHYMEALGAIVPTVFILSADRRLDSDAVSDPSDEMDVRRTLSYGEPKKLNQLVARAREIALAQAMNKASQWVSRTAVSGTNRGSTNVHSVYADVLHKIAPPRGRTSESNEQPDLAQLVRKLRDIDERSAALARYEFTTHLPTGDFQKALSTRSAKKAELAANLLKPYVKSVESKLSALEPLFRLIDRFVVMVNEMLSDKIISYKLSQGFSIVNRLGKPLRAEHLSSGEQQLLLLLCYVLTARDAPTVFMIDEPELSLNVKWQRQLVQSLLQMTDGASVQFLFASHSMELLAQHRHRVVRLDRRP
ncbi:AAA family ATPase [Luteibacter yeojuensis]|uniref:AAA family ATPase n=1 Tax=Luteibacter yeojuensis TaxID=345309 RepID=A0A7X5QRS4_9GAMM|nr:AAA family ATPase [Luteibacter yeojuensis]NID14112.1 AAA family ATPase [Luteibacter yeojuensis]